MKRLLLIGLLILMSSLTFAAPVTHEFLTNDPVNTAQHNLHVMGFTGTSAQRAAYPPSALLNTDTWTESDTGRLYQWVVLNGVGTWNQIPKLGTDTPTVTLSPTPTGTFYTSTPTFTVTPTMTITSTNTPTGSWTPLPTNTPNTTPTITPTTTATIVLFFQTVNAQGTPVGTPFPELMLQNEGIIGPWPPAFGYSRFGLFSKTNVALFGWSDVGQSELEMGNNTIDMTPGQGGNGFNLSNGIVDSQGSINQQISALSFRRSISPAVAPYPVTLSSGAATIYDANLPAYTQGTPEPYCVPVSYVSTPPPYLPYVTIAEPAGTTLTVHGASTDNNIYQIKTDSYY